MSLYDEFEIDTEAETNGVWISQGNENDDGTTSMFKLASSARTNKNYRKALNRAKKRCKTALKTNSLSEEADEKLTFGIFLDTILIDWKNVYGRSTKDPKSKKAVEGKLLKFSKENATALLTALPRLYDALLSASADDDHFNKKELEAEAKN